MNLIRVGKVSNIDYETGMVEILYPDRDEAVTAGFAYLSFNGEYKMPAIGQSVAALHLSSGTSAGIVLGPYFNRSNRPRYSGKGVYYKEIGENAYMLLLDRELTIHAEKIRLSDGKGEITLQEILQMKEDVARLKEALAGGSV